MFIEREIFKIKVIGVGGGGINMVNRMAESGVTGVEFAAIDTDRQALNRSRAQHKIQIGEQSTYGLDADSNPEVGRRSAAESLRQITKALEDVDMVFITAGMGGGTGTGAASVVAEAAKRQGILTVGVVTKPFGFEGRRRTAQAEAGIEELRNKVDSLLVIRNDRHRYAAEQRPAFIAAGNVLRQAVLSISDLVQHTGFINLDFADVEAIMRDAGPAYMGVGWASGKGRAGKAARMAISCHLLETSIDSARRILVNVIGSEDMSLDEVDNVLVLIQAAVHPDANMIYGATVGDSLDDEIRVNVIATGFDEK